MLSHTQMLAETCGAVTKVTKQVCQDINIMEEYHRAVLSSTHGWQKHNLPKEWATTVNVHKDTHTYGKLC